LQLASPGVEKVLLHPVLVFAREHPLAMLAAPLHHVLLTLLLAGHTFYLLLLVLPFLRPESSCTCCALLPTTTSANCWLGGREGCFGKGAGSGCWLGGQARGAGRVLPPRPTLACVAVGPERSM